MSFRSIASIAVFLLGSLEAQTWHPWQSLGSGLQGPPSAVSWGPNRLDIFALDLNLNIRHQWFDGSWGAGESLLTPPSALPWPALLPPTAVSSGPGRLDIFTLRSPNFDLWHQWFDGSWGSWESLGTPGFGVGMPGLGGLPSLVSWGPKRLDVFAVGLPKGGPYNQVWHGWSDGRAWGPGEWFDPKAALDQQGLTAVSWGPGRLDIFTMKGDHTSLFHQWFDGQVWGSEWLEKPPFGLKGGLSTVSWGPGRLNLFGIGQDGVLWNFWFDGQHWAPGWESLGSPPFGLVGTPSAVSWGPKRIDIFAIKSDGGLWHQWWDGAWGSGEALGSPPGGLTGYIPHFLAGGLSTVSWGPNRLDVFAIGGNNGNLWHIWYGSEPPAPPCALVRTCPSEFLDTATCTCNCPIANKCGGGCCDSLEQVCCEDTRSCVSLNNSGAALASCNGGGCDDGYYACGRIDPNICCPVGSHCLGHSKCSPP